MLAEGVNPSNGLQAFKADASGNMQVVGSATRSTTTATIANGASVSGTVDLTNTSLLGFIAPAGWTTAALNIEVTVAAIGYLEQLGILAAGRAAEILA